MSRDRTVGDTFFMLFTTRAFATGIPTVLAGTPVVSAYEDDSTTQITAGITLGVDHDSVVGLNLLTLVATGGNGYETGKDYSMVITTGTVGGVSVVGEVVGEFSLSLSAAAIDLANGTDGLGAIKTDTAAVLVDTAAMQPLVAKIPLSDGSITWNSTALGSVNAECDTAISDAALSTAANLAIVDTNVDQIETAVITNAAGTDIAADIIALKAETVLILADTADMQPKLGSPAGADMSADIAAVKVDTAAILVDTGTTLNDKIDVIDTNVDQIETAVITNAAGTDIAADIIAVKADTAAILVDTSTTLNDKIDIIDTNVDQIETAVITNAAGTDIAADIIAVKVDTAATLVDTVTLTSVFLEGAAITGTLSTTQMTTNLTEATDDHFIGRLITWTSGVLKDQQTDITDYTGSTKLLTYTATTDAPANTDTFVIT